MKTPPTHLLLIWCSSPSYFRVEAVELLLVGCWLRRPSGWTLLFSLCVSVFTLEASGDWGASNRDTRSIFLLAVRCRAELSWELRSLNIMRENYATEFNYLVI